MTEFLQAILITLHLSNHQLPETPQSPTKAECDYLWENGYIGYPPPPEQRELAKRCVKLYSGS